MLARHMRTWPVLLALTVAIAAKSTDDQDEDIGTFTFGQRLGLVFIAQSASASLAAVTSLLLYVAFNAIRNMYYEPKGSWRFLRTHVDLYFLNLLISDAVQATGGIMDLRWVIHAGVTEGQFCTAQAVLKNIGDVGVALSSLAIAVHTSAVLLWKWHAPSSFFLPSVVVGLFWLFIALENGIGYALHRHEDYFGDTNYWCWLTDKYATERIVFEYLWLWTTAFFNILIYIPLFFVLRGNLRIDGLHMAWVTIKNDEAWPRPEYSNRESTATVARQMLWYPIVYVIIVLPIAIVRWLGFTGHTIPFHWTAFAGILFSASGFLNVLVFTLTRPALLPTRRHQHCNRSHTLSSSPRSPMTVITFDSLPRHNNGRVSREAEEDYSDEDVEFASGRQSGSGRTVDSGRSSLRRSIVMAKLPPSPRRDPMEFVESTGDTRSKNELVWPPSAHLP